MLRGAGEELLARRGSEPLQGALPGQNKQEDAAESINFAAFASGADVGGDKKNFDGFTADGVWIPWRTLQKEQK